MTGTNGTQQNRKKTHRAGRKVRERKLRTIARLLAEKEAEKAVDHEPVCEVPSSEIADLISDNESIATQEIGNDLKT